jgi:large subunit ribosomal protein L10
MPTEEKIKKVEEIKDLLEKSTILISTDFTGMGADSMTALRRALRERGVGYRIVKNTLTYLAADAAGMPGVKEIVQGQTGIAFGYGDPIEPAKAISEFVRTTRLPLQVKGAVMAGQTLTAAQVEDLARLPSKDELIAKLMAQIQAPITGLVYVLSAPISALARVLQRGAESLAAGTAEPEPEAAAPEQTAADQQPETSLEPTESDPEVAPEAVEPEPAAPEETTAEQEPETSSEPSESEETPEAPEPEPEAVAPEETAAEQERDASTEAAEPDPGDSPSEEAEGEKPS